MTTAAYLVYRRNDMQIEDYDAPTPLNTDVDPRASQKLAAKKRAAAQPGRSSHDTEPIAPLAASPLPAQAQALIGGVVAVLLIGGLIWAMSWQLNRTPALPLQITPGPSTAAYLEAPTPSSAPTSAPTATAATIGAYAAPDGLLLGQIELDREIVAVAHYGTSWIQADVHGSGRVWLKAVDVPDIAITGPDLAPVADVPPQTGRGLTLGAVATPEPPQATPEPPAATPVPTAAPVVDAPLNVRAEDDCSAEHGRCDPPCTAEHGRCNEGDK
jgi:hypothetical protein